MAGVLAQLIERCIRIAEVRSLNLLHSTMKQKKPQVACFVLCGRGRRYPISYTPPDSKVSEKE